MDDERARIAAITKKIDRSLQHLDALQDSAQAFFKEHPNDLFRLHGETNSQRTKHLFRVEMLRELPLDEWGVIVGDAVHCLRSALDQLAYHTSNDPDGNLQFPIFESRKDWVTKAAAFLWGIPDPVIAAINRAQPYHRGDSAHAHPLAVLRSLSNTDKHRFIAVTALVPNHADHTITSEQGMAWRGDVRFKTGKVFEHGAVIAEMPFSPDDSGLEPQVQMDGNFTFRIAFGKRGVPESIKRKEVVPTLIGLRDAVIEVLKDVHQAMREFIVSRGGTPYPMDGP